MMEGSPINRALVSLSNRIDALNCSILLNLTDSRLHFHCGLHSNTGIGLYLSVCRLLTMLSLYAPKTIA